jgi:hypothetical protein
MFYIDTQENPTAKILAVIYFNGKQHEIVNSETWKGATVDTTTSKVLESSPDGVPWKGNTFNFIEGDFYYMLITDGCSGDNKDLLNHLNGDDYRHYVYCVHGDYSDLEGIDFADILSDADQEKLKEILTSHLRAEYLVDQVEKITEETEVIPKVVPKVTAREVFVCEDLTYGGEEEFSTAGELYVYLYNNDHLESKGNIVSDLKITRRKIEEVQIELQVQTTVSYKEV